MQDEAISVDRLTKTYPSRGLVRRLLGRGSGAAGTEALRGVSLHVHRGEAVGLLGPNGAGKTTLLEILAALLLPTSGEVRVCGYDMSRHPARLKEQTAYCGSVAQSFYPRLTGAQNLEFFAILNDLAPRVARVRIQEVLGLVGLERDGQTTFQCYSDGMKQRLALARVLLDDAPVVLLDEPTKTLDPQKQLERQQFIRRTLVDELGRTVLLVTHDLSEAEAVCDRVVLLREGTVVRVGAPAEMSTVEMGPEREPASAPARVPSAGQSVSWPRMRAAVSD